MTNNSDPEVQILKTPWLAWVFYLICFAVCIIFTGAGFEVLGDGRSFGYIVLGFSVPGLIFFLLSLLPGSNYLKLEKDSFTICSCHLLYTYKWSEVVMFKIESIMDREMVGFFTPHTQVDTYKENQMVNYGLSPKQLLDLMNSYWVAAGKKPDKPS